MPPRHAARGVVTLRKALVWGWVAGLPAKRCGNPSMRSRHAYVARLGGILYKRYSDDDKAAVRANGRDSACQAAMYCCMRWQKREDFSAKIR